ncbi:Hypothetical_protein [Hexamita inflata]|uniref:Hypothetical_protein n=1 Tax=Hexamita inflata TaxID=28002 RepID=A0AA86U385_9EUKA|nr:Hypothetical protein HINF_LOCUS26504 [Hexamita inflata]CAI9949225.1 Hypothetical protein HINF_LOCUS36870 [Hexamita inflata]
MEHNMLISVCEPDTKEIESINELFTFLTTLLIMLNHEDALALNLNLYNTELLIVSTLSIKEKFFDVDVIYTFLICKLSNQVKLPSVSIFIRQSTIFRVQTFIAALAIYWKNIFELTNVRLSMVVPLNIVSFELIFEFKILTFINVD